MAWIKSFTASASKSIRTETLCSSVRVSLRILIISPHINSISVHRTVWRMVPPSMHEHPRRESSTIEELQRPLDLRLLLELCMQLFQTLHVFSCLRLTRLRWLVFKTIKMISVILAVWTEGNEKFSLNKTLTGRVWMPNLRPLFDQFRIWKSWISKNKCISSDSKFD